MKNWEVVLEYKGFTIYKHESKFYVDKYGKRLFNFYKTLEEVKEDLDFELTRAKTEKSIEERKKLKVLEEQELKDRYNNLYGFEDMFTGIRRERVISTLNKGAFLCASKGTRKEAIKDLVEKGWRVRFNLKGERVLKSNEGSFYNTRDITKTGMDYAEFLIENIK